MTLLKMLKFLLFLFVIWSYSSIKIKVEGGKFYSNRKIISWVEYSAPRGDSLQIHLRKWIENATFDVVYEYENKGFFDVKLQWKIDSEPNLKQSEPVWNVTVVVIEGVRYLFGKVNYITTDKSVPLVDSSEFKSKRKLPFASEIAELDKSTLEKRYGDAGYAKRTVRLVTEINEEDKVVDVTYKVTPNYLVIFDSLIIRNKKENRKNYVPGISDKKFIQGLLKIKEGEMVSLSKTNNFKSKLKSTRVFNSVRLKDSLIDAETGRSILIANLIESAPGKIFGSLFWNSFEGFGTEGGWSHNNIFGEFYQGKLKARVAQRRQIASIKLTNPLLFGYRLKFENAFDFIWRQDTSLSQPAFQALFSSSLGWSRWKFMRSLHKLEFDFTQNNQYRKVDSNVVFTGFEVEKDRAINLNFINSLSLLFVDNEFNPRRGAKFTFIYGNGGPLIEDNKFKLLKIRHNWGEVNSSYYIPLASWFIVALRVDGGSFYGTNGGSNSDRFFMGGPNTIRNKDFEEVCPQKDSVTTNLEKGKITVECRTKLTPVYYLTSLEMRVKPFKWARPRNHKYLSKVRGLQVVPFTDFGRVWDKKIGLRPEGKGHDVGLGLRFPVLVFNLRFDMAKGVNNNYGWDEWRFILDLAQAF